ncbi:MAG: hypothetical protein P4L51_03240 [Puia sp.]|nr:hypothetical protein [Puia sp.]
MKKLTAAKTRPFRQTPAQNKKPGANLTHRAYEELIPALPEVLILTMPPLRIRKAGIRLKNFRCFPISSQHYPLSWRSL